MSIRPFLLLTIIVTMSMSAIAQEAQSQTEEEVLIPSEPMDEEMVEQPQVFMIVEEMPEFPGGEVAMQEFIVDNLVYPQDLKDDGYEGVVYIQFIVRETGEIDPESINILRGVHARLDQEAVNVILKMPTWTPGKQRKKPVSVYYTHPIRFVRK